PGRAASRAQGRAADFLQAVGLNRGHFVALPFFCAVSDRRRGRIAAARPRTRPRRPPFDRLLEHAVDYADRVVEARALYLKYRGQQNVLGEKPCEAII